MKYIVVLGDGMADRPLSELGGKTPLEVAKKPGMDYMAKYGRSGMLRTLVQGMPFGSDIANLAVLGYDPKKYYAGGRGAFEAAALRIHLGPSDLAFRCNLITEEKGVLRDYSAGHVSSREAEALIKHVDRVLGNGKMRFYPGVGYRHVMVLKDAGISYEDLLEQPPHDIVGKRIRTNLLKAKNRKAASIVDSLNEVMLSSKKALEGHAINIKRLEEKKLPANMIWLWGAGKKPSMPSFRQKYGLSGALISAVYLLRGLAFCMDLEVVEVPGATGYFDTDYPAKAEYALKALEKNDFVYIHVEAPDEAGHDGNIAEKVKAIEKIDKEIVSRIMEEYGGRECRIAVLPDHATPIEARTHTPDPVPFVIYSPGMEGDGLSCYSEKEAAKGSYGTLDGVKFMEILLKKE